ncbi:hypothetical protein CISG_06233 [Coccidioides immitis RMSCC 3703]|uniref:Uncharacterized protein n=2 Tax=Coccidioides immitis TaxID=5501 RepID=A0A0J8R019_COCIT|nr:hypothetical protein CIRG_06451 [Coccidioides immitis RMSCC 2394]KMU76998.1 hypothetical protein CISG_06233 [Coccidioides immitis RMSCC 3703]
MPAAMTQKIFGSQPLHGEDRRLFAWGDARGDFSKIVFCNKFFKDLPSSNNATSEGKFKSKGLQDNLEHWDNRGRVFFHEAVHMASLIYPQDKTPSVEDAEIKFKEGDKTATNYAYGPYYAKLLRNWVQKDKGGFYTQRNADSYAFFALAKYVEKQINRYPHLPTPGSKKVESEPQIAGQTARDSDGKRARYVPLHTRGGDDGLLGDKELEYKDQHIKEFSIPACPDFYPQSSKPKAEGKKPNLVCDNKSPSKIPRIYLVNLVNQIGHKFCEAVDKDRNKQLTWNVSTNGEERKAKRGFPLFLWVFQNSFNPKPWALELSWEPKDVKEKCHIECKDAFRTMFLADCDGKQPKTNNDRDSLLTLDSGQRPGLVASASLDADCGVFKYKTK